MGAQRHSPKPRGAAIGSQYSARRSVTSEVLHCGDLIAFLEASPLVIVRDPASVDHAADLGARDPILGTDVAFALSLPAVEGERRGVGVVLTDHTSHSNERMRRRRGSLDLGDRHGCFWG